LTFNGKLYWFRVMRYGGEPFGPYVNRNHFAGFAEILIPVALVPLVLERSGGTLVSGGFVCRGADRGVVVIRFRGGIVSFACRW